MEMNRDALISSGESFFSALSSSSGESFATAMSQLEEDLHPADLLEQDLLGDEDHGDAGGHGQQEASHGCDELVEHGQQGGAHGGGEHGEHGQEGDDDHRAHEDAGEDHEHPFQQHHDTPRLHGDGVMQVLFLQDRQ